MFWIIALALIGTAIGSSEQLSGLCRPIFTRTSGGFTSPNYPSKYPNDIDCTYKIASSSGNQILIQFSRFQLESESNCRYDYVTITSRSGQQIGPRLCGRLSGTSYLVPGSYAIIKFVSDGSGTYPGFRLAYKVIGTCRDLDDVCDNGCIVGADGMLECTCKPGFIAPKGVVQCYGCQLTFTNTSGGFTSPNYPNHYPHNINCTYEIASPTGNQILIQFPRFSLEGGSNCQHDYVSITSRSGQQIGPKLCGDLNGNSYLVSGSHAIIKFVSDGSDTFGGFKLTYKVIGTCKELDDVCDNGCIVGADGMLECTCKPGYYVPKGEVQCYGCQLTFTNTSGGFTSPKYSGYYPNNINCTYEIASPTGNQILIQFPEFRLQGGSNCQRDYVSITSRNGQQIGPKLCGDLSEKSYLVPGSHAIIKFVSDGSGTKPGFELTYKVIETCKDVCDNGCIVGADGMLECRCKPGFIAPRGVVQCYGCQLTFTNTSGGFTSPYYPNNYPNNINCTYTIASSTGNQILIQFPIFQLESQSECQADYVSITSRSGQQIGPNLCGDLSGTSYLVSGSHAIIKFVSDQSNTKAGFELTYNVIDCGTQATNLQPTFKTQRYNIHDSGVVETRNKRRRRASARHGKILGGEIAQHGSWPWTVSLQDLLGHFCGGTLIRPMWVMTAAHCFKKNTETRYLSVKAGHNRGTEAEMQKRGVLDIILHEEYVNATYKNDICLLKLKSSFQINNYVRLACMPQPDYEVPGGSFCIVSGWGKTHDTNTQVQGMSPNLKQAVVPIHNHSDCIKYMGEEKMLDKTQMCGGKKDPRHDTCSGDSGGPLVCLNNTKWTVQGVTSWGWDNCKYGDYGSYTRVSKYLDWIYNKLYPI